MDEKILAIYGLCADFLQALGHAEEPQQQMSDAEVITTGLQVNFLFHVRQQTVGRGTAYTPDGTDDNASVLPGEREKLLVGGGHQLVPFLTYEGIVKLIDHADLVSTPSEEKPALFSREPLHLLVLDSCGMLAP